MLGSSGSSGAYGGAYAGVSVKDTDEDGHLDFIVGNPSASTVRIIRGDGRGRSLTGEFTVPTSAPPGDL